MDWLTKDYIQAEAKKGRKRAIECTRLHWWQLWKAGPKELNVKLGSHVDISNEYCAMCLRYFKADKRNTYGKCYNCPLNCWKIWFIAEESLGEWGVSLDGWDENAIRSNWRKWKQASKAMLDKIDRLYERLYGSKP
jgi:hypothetical protein